MPEDKGQGNGATTPGSNTLSEEDRQNLFFHHRRIYAAKLAAKDKATAELRAVGKLAKAELGDHAVDMIKTSLVIETESGESEIKAEIERAFQVARWMAVPLGSQTDLFVDTVSAVDRATAEGLRDGKLGAVRQTGFARGSPEYIAYEDAYDDGQKAIMDFGRRRDAASFAGLERDQDDETRRQTAAQKPSFADAEADGAIE